LIIRMNNFLMLELTFESDSCVNALFFKKYVNDNAVYKSIN